MLLSAVENRETTTIEAERIGPPLLFERLWRDCFCRSAIENLLADRAVFLTVLHRIMDPGSDRAAEKWRSAYSIAGMEAIDLHHLYRAMAWLGEERADQQGRGLVPRTNKDLIEERLFAKRRNLFNDVGLCAQYIELLRGRLCRSLGRLQGCDVPAGGRFRQLALLDTAGPSGGEIPVARCVGAGEHQPRLRGIYIGAVRRDDGRLPLDGCRRVRYLRAIARRQ
jgi:hypothetical protein